jgi:GTPase SAR1 family protein
LSREKSPDVIIDQHFEMLRSELGALLKDMHSLVADIGNDAIEMLISDIRETVYEPFLFVVVGEIKAGKSSLVNALLGESVCPVDPAPCTDTIQLIVHGETPAETEIAPHVRRIERPVEILKRIAIVDTPGTNTIIPHHEEITRRFIPNSGLVIFVFPAKNPHTNSAWTFLDYVGGEWRKKVIFVLQQADLTTHAELQTNIEKVKEYAEQRGFGESPVFVSSAKMEECGEPGSGFDEIRNFIRETVTGGRHLFLKLQSSLDTAEQTLKKVYEALQEHEKQLAADRALSQRMEKRIQAGESKMHRDVQRLIDHVLNRYDQVTRESLDSFREGLSFSGIYYRSVRSIFHRKDSMGNWVGGLQEKMGKQLATAFSDIVVVGSRQIVEDIRELAAALRKEFAEAESRIDQNTRAVVDLGNRREETILDIQSRIDQILQSDFFLDAPPANPESMTTVLMGGSLLTVIGAMVLVTTHTAFFDITGGIMTGAGLLLSGSTLLLHRKRLIDQLGNRIRDHRTLLDEELRQRIIAAFDPILADLRDLVQPFLDDLSHRTVRLENWMRLGEGLQQRLLGLTRKLQRAEVDREK